MTSQTGTWPDSQVSLRYIFRELFFSRLSCLQTLSTMLSRPGGLNMVVLKFREVKTRGGQTSGHPWRGSLLGPPVFTQWSSLSSGHVQLNPDCQGLIEDNGLLSLLLTKRHRIVPSFSTSYTINRKYGDLGLYWAQVSLKAWSWVGWWGPQPSWSQSFPWLPTHTHSLRNILPTSSTKCRLSQPPLAPLLWNHKWTTIKVLDFQRRKLRIIFAFLFLIEV